MRTLKTCLSIFRIRAAEGFAYRAAWVVSSLTGIIWVLIEIVVYQVFFTYADNAVAGMQAALSLNQVCSYAWAGQALFLMQPMSVDADIHRKIVNGDVGIELCRPLDLYAHWFMRVGAGKIAPLAVRGSVTIAFGLFMRLFGLGLGPPASPAGLLWALTATAGAFFLCCAYGMLVNAIRLNISWGEGPTYLMMLIGGVLSGGYLPLQLWPEALQRFLAVQPFAGYMDIPLRLYVGSAAPTDALPLLCAQAFWIAAFIIAGRLIMKRRLQTVIVQGG